MAKQNTEVRLEMPFDNSFLLCKKYLPLEEKAYMDETISSRAFNPSVDNPPWELGVYTHETDFVLPFIDTMKPHTVKVDLKLFPSTSPLVQKVNLKKVENHYKPEQDLETEDPYCEDFAELKYYDSKPTCFMILGKETISSRLAKKMSDYWGCICIDVEVVLKEHLKVNDLVSMHLNTTLKNGRVLRNRCIQTLLEQRVNTPNVQHRGYVLCGLPFIPIGDDPTAQHQMSDIFSWELKPDVLIYLTCPDADVINYRQQLRYDLYDSGNLIDMGLLGIGKRMQRVYSNKKEGKMDEKEELYEDNYYEVEEEKVKLEATIEKYLVTRVRDTPQYVQDELVQYQKHILPVVEYYILKHNPQFVIKLDGRASANHSFLVLKEKLEVLPIQHVYHVERLNGAAANVDASSPENIVNELKGEEEEEEFSENQTPQNAFDELSIKNIPGPRFRWRWSHWGSKCPVALTDGHCVEGNPKYAVKFKDKIFFLSDEDAMNSFILNPRKYLHRPKPELTCKICIVGPKLAGKSTLAYFLSAIFHGKVVNWQQIKAKNMLEKHQTNIDKKRLQVIQETIDEIKAAKQKEYEEAIESQPNKLQKWTKEVTSVLQQYVDSYRPSQEFYDTLRGSDDREVKTELEIRHTESFIRKVMDENNIPAWGNPEFAEQLLEDTDSLMKYCPSELLQPIREPSDISENDPILIEDVNKKLGEIEVSGYDELSSEEMAALLIESIQEIEGSTFYSSRGLKHGGWIIDDFPIDAEVMDLLSQAGLVPDHIICLNDRDETSMNLLQRWTTREGYLPPEVYTSDLVSMMENMSPGFENHDILTPIIQSSYLPQCVGISTIAAGLGGSAENIPWPSNPLEMIIPPAILFESESSPDITSTIQSELFTEDSLTEHPSIQDYIKTLSMYKTQWENCKSHFESKNQIIEIYINNKTIIQLLYEAALKLVKTLRKAPHEMTDQEKSDEMEHQIREQQGPTLMEEYPEEVGSQEMKDTRRYGDTSMYCPVAFRLNRVLWPGQTEFACMFQDKIYNLSSERAMKMFLEHPVEFAPFTNPPKGMPPIRICVVGAIGSGKSTVSQILGERLGVYVCDYTKTIEDYLVSGTQKVGRKYEDSPDQLITELDEGDSSRLNMIRKYLLNGTPMLDKDMKQVIAPFWSYEPYKSGGFVLDGFPFRIPDTNFMRKYYFIPDIIIELDISMETAVARSVKSYIQLWEERKKEKIEQKRKEDNFIFEQWESKKSARYKHLISEFKSGRHPKMQMTTSSEELKEEPKKNIFGPSERTTEGQQLRKEQEEKSQSKSEEEIHNEADETEAIRKPLQTLLNEQEQDWILSEVNDIITAEFPKPPVSEYIFEDGEEANERIQEEIEGWYEKDTDDLEVIRETIKAENIPWVTINAEQDLESLVHNIEYLVDKFKYRKNSCVMERVYDVSQQEAENLLHHGYYFLSKFGRWCPVQIAKNINPVQMYIPNASKEKCIPVIHRRYIYFVANEEHRQLFGQDPLKYIKQAAYIPIIPIRVSIFGPPKCGKTTLAERLSKELGVRVITIGSAIRQVLFLYPGSELAKNIEQHKQQGTRVPDKLKIQAVECEMLANRSLVQGVIFDGFPHSTEQILELSLIGSIPTMIINLNGDLDCTLEGLHSLQASTEYYSHDPVFSEDMVREKYKNWEKVHKPFVEFMRYEYQNVIDIPVEYCKWWIYKESLQQIYKNLQEIKEYLQQANQGFPVSLRAMGISSQEFLSRQSTYQHYCPVCLEHNILNTCGFPPKCTNLIQYHWHYYCLCSDHYDIFMENPQLYISPKNKAQLPKSLPVPLGEKDSVDSDSFVMDGLCIVHYYDTSGLAVQRETGLWYLMVEFCGKIYHFCSPTCQEKFMKQPEKYAQVAINYNEEVHPLTPVSQLPNLGYMEQTLARALVSASLAVDEIRPKYPCLDLSKSGAIYVGTYLKTINTMLGTETVKEYSKCLQRLQEQSKRVSSIAKQWQIHINPYIQTFNKSI